MSKWKTIGAMITEEEYNEFMDYLQEYNKSKRIAITPNKFIRTLLIKYIRNKKTLLISEKSIINKELISTR